MEFHEVASIFPLLMGDELQSLKDDIAQNGLIESIWTYQGKIIDGRNRYVACLAIDVEPQYREWGGSGSLVSFVVSMNLKRRHLSSSQQGFITLDVEERLIAELQLAKDNAELFPQFVGGTREEAARIVGVNPHYVTDAKKIQHEAPDLADKVRAGEMTIPKAIQQIRRQEVITDLSTIEAKEAKAIKGIYDVIVIDPPWPMQKIERNIAPNQVLFEYPTMTLDAITELNIPIADACHVWLWTTQKFLPDAFDILTEWGLKYICTFVWHKPGGFQPFNLPQYNCEFALYARRGSPPFIELKDFNTCFNAARSKHSEKPQEFYDMVNRVTAGRRLDMFNRRSITGFDGWGNETEGG